MTAWDFADKHATGIFWIIVIVSALYWGRK